MAIQGELLAATARSAEDVAAQLQVEARRPVRLTLTRNRVSLASVRFDGRAAAAVRLHESFLQAPDEILAALGRYLRTRRREDWQVVAAYARTIHAHSGRPVRAPDLDSRGRVWNLGAIADEINREFFGGRIRCQVGWGRSRPKRRRLLWRRGRSIRYGSWDVTTRTVRVHPILDDACVPREFVRYIVFHEMLHALVPGERRGGRFMHHPRQFRVLERQFPNLAGMNRLAKTLLDVLV